jgi:ribosomal protein L31
MSIKGNTLPTISAHLTPTWSISYTWIEVKDNLKDSIYTIRAVRASTTIRIDLSVNDHPYFAHGFHVESAYNYVRGEVLSLTSFSLMPQSILNSVLKYNFNDGEKWKRKQLVIQHQYFLPKMLVSSF